MSGTDNSPEKAHEASTQTPIVRPTRGIDPPGSSNGPPPPHDFGIVAHWQTESPHVDIDSSAGNVSGQRTSRPWPIAAIVAAIVAVLLLVFGLVVVGISSLVSVAGDPGAGAPSSEDDNSGQSDPDLNPSDPGPAAGAVETSLQAMIDEYKSARDTGSLWATIPESAFNRTAVDAFLYLLIDLRLAASFGADTSGYLEQADELEQKLLNEEPLGTDISITLSDRTFTYDGDTGEGGYSLN